jgi:hypothetical protein
MQAAMGCGELNPQTSRAFGSARSTTLSRESKTLVIASDNELWGDGCLAR